MPKLAAVNVLLLIGAWFGASVPAALAVGAALHAGAAQPRQPRHGARNALPVPAVRPVPSRLG